MKKLLAIDQIFDMEQWTNLQRSLAEVTNMAIITVDYKGIPVTEHSCCHEFCKKVRSDPTLGKFCQKCDSRGGLEAVRVNEPYIYQCHFSIVDIAIPIMVNDKYLGAVMAGQVRLPVHKDDSFMEKIFSPANSRVIEEAKENLKELYNQIPFLSYERMQMIAMMLYYLCNYMVREAIHKEQIIEMYETVVNRHQEILEEPPSANYSLESARKMKAAISNVILNSNIENAGSDVPVSTNSIIIKAFDYIYHHKGESPSLKNMASYCNVSSSYLSRLFTKEVGESYSSFTARLKIEWAKALLESSDAPISEISDELGYSEAGYFIKSFKKYVGVTPAVYRTYCKS